MGIDYNEIKRCLYDHPKDIRGASNKLLDIWQQTEFDDNKKWQQLYSALHLVLPPEDMRKCDAEIRGEKLGRR